MAEAPTTARQSKPERTTQQRAARGRSPWHELLGSTPNQLTALRLALLLPLWVLALLQIPVAVGVLVAIAASTDVLDGYLARSRDLVTEFGARFDSVADHLLTGSTVAWLLLLRPEFFREQRTLLLVWLAVGAAVLLVGWVRFRRIGGIHLYSAKAASFLGYCFAIYLLIFGTYPALLFYAAIGAAFLAAAETLLVQLTRNEIDENMGTFFAGSRHADAGDRHDEPSTRR